jgi:TolB-like protein
MDVAFGPYRLRQQERIVLGPEGPIELSARSFDILTTLLAKPNELIDKSVLFAAVWPGLAVEENTLQVHVSALRKALGPDLIATIHGRGYKYAGPVPTEVAARASAAASEKIVRKPMVAVLPFANLSGDPEQLYFADGITGDIIDRLSRFRILSVIGLESSFALRHSPAAISDARDKLKAEFVLSGSVRKADGRIRIAARLTESASGTTCWADHYDRPLADVFALQDEVAGIIANTLVGRVEIEIGSRSSAMVDQDISSYELVLQGLWHYRKETLEGIAAAQRCFERAITTDPNNAEAHRHLAICFMYLWWSAFQPEGLAKAFAAASRAVELDPANGGCHQALAVSRLWTEGTSAASASIARSLDLNPGDPHALTWAGVIAAYSGNLPDARHYAGHASRLNPLPPLCFPELSGIAAFVEGRYADALPGFEALPDCAWDNTYVLACHALLDQSEKVAQIRERNARAGKKWDHRGGAIREPFAEPEPRERLLEGLKKALAL